MSGVFWSKRFDKALIHVHGVSDSNQWTSPGSTTKMLPASKVCSLMPPPATGLIRTLSDPLISRNSSRVSR